ncbi:hypothetical protein AWJ20_1697 [Sugiyamaella lignohabitans]|uniref:SWIRM domain-containing protein n=1 Tax=Sugiyamaella lignohabitans TaxID=796027 RepID=A0A161HKC4_9ASCO|nr:uncharacterized protein AWJ20_1697 [Sugiyamaella lignohabitans]ANB13407.1 hypothetical protein AWJ20_1697 [Sugiyamaella lignohabitans]
MNSLSPAQIDALLYMKQDQVSSPAISEPEIFIMDQNSNSKRHSASSDSQNDEDSSIAMLSPPLSPYPTKAYIAPVFQVSEKEGSIARPLSRSELIKPSSSSIPSVFDAAPVVRSGFKSKRSSLKKSSSAIPRSSHNPYKVAKHDPKNPLISSAWSSFQNDPVGYFRRERAYLDLYPVNGPTWSNYVSVEPINLPSALLLRSSAGSSSRANRSRASSARRRNDYSSDSDASSMVTRSSMRAAGNNSSTAVPKVSYSDYSDSGVSTPLPAPTPRRPVSRAPSSSRSSTPSRVHDLSLSQITDYSPSPDTLPPGKSLRAEWKGAPMDLSDDPNVHLLHPAEVHLASVLRLPGDLYLDSKKRLFAEKVHRMRQGLPFRRTDSQKACRIDVNKASRLFSAFEKVGWLEDHHFKRFL